MAFSLYYVSNSPAALLPFSLKTLFARTAIVGFLFPLCRTKTILTRLKATHYIILILRLRFIALAETLRVDTNEIFHNDLAALGAVCAATQTGTGS